MSSIQKRLNDLQPYVVGIRFVSNIPVIDVVFKENWQVPDSTIVHKERSEQDPNYYYFYTEKENIGADELLDYVEEIIKINIEREVKQELLKVKVKELQLLFRENSLDKLKNLKFVLGKENLVPDLMNDDFNVDIEVNQPEPATPIITPEPVVNEPVIVNQPNRGSTTTNAWAKKQGMVEVELPPKGGKIELEDYSLPESVTQGECNCGENDACPRCMDRKGL